MISFEVRSSSSDEVYQLAAVQTDGKVRFTCTCVAGAMGQACKHRLSLLVGDVSRVVGDVSGLERLLDLVRGSRIEQRLEEIAALEAEMGALKRKVSSVKKALGREMAEGA